MQTAKFAGLIVPQLRGFDSPSARSAGNVLRYRFIIARYEVYVVLMCRASRGIIKRSVAVHNVQFVYAYTPYDWV